MRRAASQALEPDAADGFTRYELLAVVVAAALLGLLALPGLAGTRSRTERVVCANNLRQIGQAFQQWADEHNDTNPWWVPFSSGGLSTYENVGPFPAWAGMALNAWFHFAWVSNHFQTPKILVCPADSGPNVRIARDFSTSPDGGFVNPAYRNNAVSYMIDLHSMPGHATAVLCSDSNLSGLGLGGCTALRDLGRVTSFDPSYTVWSGETHDNQGNLVLNDGRVLFTSSFELGKALTDPLRPNRVHHALLPR